jgi:hypothetical protein
LHLLVRNAVPRHPKDQVDEIVVLRCLEAKGLIDQRLAAVRGNLTVPFLT